jgi:hypothetical protein
MTALDNLPNIFQYGLLSRNEAIRRGLLLTDIADKEIVGKRQELHIDNYIPFHFFEKTPFAGAVIKNNPSKDFCFIAITREFAQKSRFQICTAHPLSANAGVYDWSIGMQNINWLAAETRNFNDNESKNACMAECLAVSPLYYSAFFCIFVKDEKSRIFVDDLATSIIGNYPFEIWSNDTFF